MSRKRSGITIADVAKHCGVGVMTVSRVINGGNLVSAETAARVRSAIKKLGYQPNEAARMLKGRISRTIGLILPDLSDTFFSVCAHSVQQFAAKRGYTTVLLASERDANMEVAELAMLKARSIAGILIFPSSEACIPGLKSFSANGTPVVMIDRTYAGVDAGQVVVDNRGGAEKAVAHLLEHGHNNIWCVGYDKKYNSISQRIAGYEAVLRQAGLRPKFVIVDEADQIAPNLIPQIQSSELPIAIFALNNVTSLCVLQVLRQRGISVPRQVAVVGFDDFEFASLLSVPLTAIRQPADELGRSGTRLLFEMMGANARTHEPARIVLPTELVIRNSCGCQVIPYQTADRVGASDAIEQSAGV
ncbi:MAG TPA: LacI family DNA-binding transcriptional regulator [Candidatus Sulfotelmatobacter sp.]|nr:LacI family DNA-binding transcriptional regulator [Candidatus Sulfotelmatobacter sp.]